MKINGMMLLTS